CTGALCTAAVRRPALLAPAIVAAGLALGSKTTTLVPLVACLGVTVWVLRARLRSLLAPVAAAVVAAFAIGWLWFVRDIVLYGSPFWPHVSVPWGASKPRFFDLVGRRFIDRPVAPLRYLLPAMLTAVVAVALAARVAGRAGTAATVVLSAAVIWNVVELAQLGPPYTPSLLVLAAGIASGLAVLGAALALSRATGRMA